MAARIVVRRLGSAPGLLMTESQDHSSRIKRSASTKLMRVGSTFASGKPRKHGIPSHKVRSIAEAIEELGPRAFRTVTWRTETKDQLRGVFAARRVRLGDGGKASRGEVLPGREVWLVCEQRENERKYYVTNHEEGAETMRRIVSAIKARWSCEQAHQQLKEELGLDHFEGRSWRGLRHHALLLMIAFEFLQQERVRENKPPA